MCPRVELRGQYPRAPIYKAFSEHDHALSFVNRGLFRMGSLQSYREIEDAGRQDGREGSGHIQVPGVIEAGYFKPGDPDFFETREEEGLQQYRMEMGNPIYILSTSIEGVDLNFIKSRWPYVVRIGDPMQLGIDVSLSLACRAGFRAGVEGRIVRYDYGEVVDEAMDVHERSSLSYYQKPSSFKSENEFRLVAIDTCDATHRVHHDYIQIDLGGPIEYAYCV